MEIIPAIDIIDGKCVRLFQGDYNKVSNYSDSPLLVAKRWKEMGAKWIHFIDLDGARYGKPVNIKTAAEIKKNIEIKLEYGGGIRTIKDVSSLLNIGIDRLIISTKALEDFSFIKKANILSNKKIIISLDFNEKGVVLKRGWIDDTGYSAIDFGKKIFNAGIREIIITDTSRDGTLQGINKDLIKNFVNSTGLKIYIAGGVSKIEDIVYLKSMKNLKIIGVIIGKALYENKIDLKEAINIAISNDNKKNHTMP